MAEKEEFSMWDMSLALQSSSLKAHWFNTKGDVNSNFAKNRARTFETIEPVDPDVFSICYWFEAPWMNI
jgi:hypothetical protein